jgi:hypothetical protein
MILALLAGAHSLSLVDSLAFRFRKTKVNPVLAIVFNLSQLTDTAIETLGFLKKVAQIAVGQLPVSTPTGDLRRLQV